jgi:pimeloyl-ACP methyl ester carboxylesterase
VPTAEVNGQSLYYEVHGEGEPLLCVMGLAANTLAWTLQMQPFGERHKAVFFDNRDVGQSSMADAPYTLEDMAQDALALADELELDSFHLVGVSMGGAIAQHMALAAPERIRTLTLAVTFAGAGAWGHKLNEIWADRRAKQTPEQQVDELMLLTLSEEFFENTEMVGYMRTMMLSDPNPQPADAFARQLTASSHHDARGKLGSLPMPVHVIGAEWDILVPVWKSQQLMEELPEGSKLTVLPRAPHGVQIERAEEFNTAVLDFIAERSPAPA